MPRMQSQLSAVELLGHEVNIYCGEITKQSMEGERYRNHRQPARTDRPNITCVM